MFYIKTNISNLLLRKNKRKKIDITLRNFLSYLLAEKYEDSYYISHSYSEAERREFVYNCALNTIDEYIHNHEGLMSSQSIIKLCKENFKLSHFERLEIPTNISDKTKLIIDKFEVLKDNLNGDEKARVIKSIDDIIASAV